MTAITRRGFLRRSSALAGAALLPIPKAMALVAPEGPRLRWFAVGHSDEMAYPMLAESLDQAIRFYAHENGQTKGEACPECDEPACTEHLDSSRWDEPHDWIEEYSKAPRGWDAVPVDREPTNVEWLRAGYNVPCEGCMDGYWECTDCYEYDGKALCCECLDVAKMAKLDDIIGNAYPTIFQGTKL